MFKNYVSIHWHYHVEQITKSFLWCILYIWIYLKIILLVGFGSLHSPLCELIYFRNSFCIRIKNSWDFRHKVLSHVGPLAEKLYLSVFLGIVDILSVVVFFFNFLFVLSQNLYTTIASTANIEEVMKCYKGLHIIYWGYRAGNIAYEATTFLWRQAYGATTF